MDFLDKDSRLTNQEKLYAAEKYGIHLTMDADPYNFPNAGVPAVFTTEFYPAVIKQVLKPFFFSTISEPMQSGNFETNNVEFSKIDWTGENNPYTDYNLDGIAEANVNWEPRDVYRLQNLINYGELETATYGRINIDIIAQKRQASAYIIGRDLNEIGFLGVQGKKIYGVLNDPSLAPTIVFPASAANPASSKWVYKTPVEIIRDIQLLVTDIANRSAGNIRIGLAGQDAYLVVSPNAYTYLTTPTDLNLESMPLTWIKRVFPGLEVIAAPEYVIGDSSAGDRVQLIFKTFNSMPVVGNLYTYLFRAHNIEIKTSSYLQKFSAGTAGAAVLQPIFIGNGTGA